MGNLVRIHYKESIDNSIVERFIQDNLISNGFSHQWESNIKQLLISDRVYEQIVQVIDFESILYYVVGPEEEVGIVE